MMQTILVQGVDTFFEEHGDKSHQPIVFIHGYPGRPQDFRWLVPHLSAFRLIILAMPGLDHTPLPRAEISTVSARADFVIAFLGKLQIDCCVLVAHSMGGVIGVHIAAHYPKLVSNLILISSVGPKPYRAFRRSRPDWGHHLFTKTPLKLISKPIVRFLFAFFGFPRGVSTEAMFYVIECGAKLSFPEHERNLSSVQQPTFSIWCRDDPLMEEQSFHNLREVLPHCQEHAFDRGGHSPQKKYATEVAQLMKRFVEKHHD